MRVEKFVNDLIPFLIVPFSVVVIVDLFFNLSKYIYWIMVVDACIVVVLGVDLFCKYKSFKSKNQFFRKYWIDFFALVPYYFYFRLIKLIRIIEVTNLFSRVKLSFFSKSRAGYDLRRRKR